VSAWTKEQRAIAAADLACRGGREALATHPTKASVALRVAAEIVADACDCESIYRAVLKMLTVTPDDIDAAVAAISRGEHPPDSLPGKVDALRRRAEEEGSRNRDRPTQAPRDFGREEAFGEVLALLGCEVPK
jgi:hypothetical protein